MPRKKQIKITIEPDLPLKDNQYYPVQVEAITVNNKTNEMKVSLHHLDKEHMLTRDVVLPLPARPNNLTGRYFTACNLSISIGKEIMPTETIGCKLMAKFNKPINSNEYEIMDFQPVARPREPATELAPNA